jgi:hypothetical protein
MPLLCTLGGASARGFGFSNVISEPEYIGSVTKDAGKWTGFDSSAEALDVLGITGVTVGDLVIMAFSFDNNPTDITSSYISWQGGMDFNANIVYNGTGGTSPGYFVGYHIIQSGDTNPWLNVGGFTAGYQGWSMVASVFRGVTTLDQKAQNGTISGMPTGSTLSSGSVLYVVTGHLDDDLVTNTGAPSGMTLAANQTSEFIGSTTSRSTTMLAYSFDETTTTIGAFTGSGSDSGQGISMRFS